MNAERAPYTIDEVDRQLIAATEAGLPRVSKPYHAVADGLGISADEVMARLGRMLDIGVIRRIGVVPNHYRLGYAANGMSVWNVADADVAAAGTEVGGLEFVSHCYERPRHLPLWPYNLFAMVHGKSRDEVSTKVDAIAALLGERDRGHEILYSTRILKKTGFRTAA